MTGETDPNDPEIEQLDVTRPGRPFDPAIDSARTTGPLPTQIDRPIGNIGVAP